MMTVYNIAIFLSAIRKQGFLFFSDPIYIEKIGGLNDPQQIQHNENYYDNEQGMDCIA